MSKWTAINKIFKITKHSWRIAAVTQQWYDQWIPRDNYLSLKSVQCFPAAADPWQHVGRHWTDLGLKSLTCSTMTTNRKDAHSIFNFFVLGLHPSPSAPQNTILVCTPLWYHMMALWWYSRRYFAVLSHQSMFYPHRRWWTLICH